MSKKSRRKGLRPQFAPHAVQPPPNSGNLTARIQKTEVFSGPMPHPELLNGYNQIVPGAAERIIRMAEEDAAHLREVERLDQQSYANNFRRGQWFAASVCGLAFALAAFVAWLGHPASAAVIGGGIPLAQLASAFLSQQPWRRRRTMRTHGGNTSPDGLPAQREG